MDEKGKYFRNRYRIPSARLVGWDYRRSVPYFVTICTQGMRPLFGYVENDQMVLNTLGEHARQRLDDITTYSKSAVVTVGQVMPNHVHAIIKLTNHTNEYQPNRFGPLLKGSLSSVVNHYKGRVTRYAKENDLPWGWQGLFHDHIIRSEEEYQRIYQYIVNNPRAWGKDRFNRGMGGFLYL